MKKLVLLGASGNAFDVLDIVQAINARQPAWDVVGVLDDGGQERAESLSIPYLGPLDRVSSFDGCQFINCIGSEKTYTKRQKLINKLNLECHRFATLVHPAASISNNARLGVGSYVSFGCSVGGNCIVGDHVSLAPCSIVGHDSRIEDYVMMAPAAVVSGFVTVGTGSYLGARSVIKQQLTIGPSALVGMGAVVTRNVEPSAVVVGVPARSIEERAFS